MLSRAVYDNRKCNNRGHKRGAHKNSPFRNLCNNRHGVACTALVSPTMISNYSGYGQMIQDMLRFGSIKSVLLTLFLVAVTFLLFLYANKSFQAPGN